MKIVTIATVRKMADKDVEVFLNSLLTIGYPKEVIAEAMKTGKGIYGKPPEQTVITVETGGLRGLLKGKKDV